MNTLFLSDYLNILNIDNKLEVIDNLMKAKKQFSLKQQNKQYPTLVINGKTFDIARYKAKFDLSYYMYRVKYETMNKIIYGYIMSTTIKHLIKYLETII